MKAAADHRGCQRRQLGLHRSLECARKPLRRLHDNIDQILAPGQPQLGALLVEVTDGLLDFAPGGLAHIGSVVQHPIHRRLAQPGLLSDLTDPVAMRHAALLDVKLMAKPH